MSIYFTSERTVPNKNALRVVRGLLRRRFPTARVWCDSDPRRNRYTWNGKRTMVLAGDLPEHWLHDIAHALVAPDERIGLPEFGPGSDPYRYTDGDRLRIVSFTEANDEEAVVCDLQWTLAAWLGWSTDAVEKEVNLLFPLPEAILRATISVSRFFTDDERVQMMAAFGSLRDLKIKKRSLTG